MESGVTKHALGLNLATVVAAVDTAVILTIIAGMDVTRILDLAEVALRVSQ